MSRVLRLRKAALSALVFTVVFVALVYGFSISPTAENTVFHIFVSASFYFVWMTAGFYYLTGRQNCQK